MIFLKTYSYEDLTKREKLFPAYDVNQIYEHIWKGGMPALQNFDAEQMNSYYSSYIETYLMRDAVDDNGISDTEGFRRVLSACAASGHFFENYVVGELLRNNVYGEANVNMTYYRDTNQKEIDVVIEENGVLHPIEIKI